MVPVVLKTANERLATYGKDSGKKNATEEPAFVLDPFP